ncbi:MAG: TlyA family rRNA (cytidine-2'-O)-methyltransferase, partial [Methanobacteriota archaeon]
MRLDQYLVRRGLVASRSKGVQLIKMGNVLVNGKPVLKPSFDVKSCDRVELKSKYCYVGRGGYKLEKFLGNRLDCRGRKVLDIGCSIGGFSDFFLKQGVSKVVAVDIAEDIIDKRLLKDDRLKFFGGVDARDNKMLEMCIGDEKFDIVSVDVSIVSLKQILPCVSKFLKPNGFIVALFKPSYEGGKDV